mmetsp:Transcript_10447/g.18352  ORF Transcript_10447/g.18352 Transcript_10447/m.18352 type:complete len:239 (-) Transcript_10447:502-1218(-)
MLVMRGRRNCFRMLHRFMGVVWMRWGGRIRGGVGRAACMISVGDEMQQQNRITLMSASVMKKKDLLVMTTKETMPVLVLNTVRGGIANNNKKHLLARMTMKQAILLLAPRTQANSRNGFRGGIASNIIASNMNKIHGDQLLRVRRRHIRTMKTAIMNSNNSNSHNMILVRYVEKTMLVEVANHRAINAARWSPQSSFLPLVYVLCITRSRYGGRGSMVGMGMPVITRIRRTVMPGSVF